MFDGCTGLTSLTVNEANSAFEMSGKVLLSKDKTTLVFSLVDHYDTYSVPDTVTTIYGDAFSDCKLTSVVIPDSVTTIGNYAFSGCSRLTTVTLGNGVEAISQGMFFSCKELTSLTIPNSVTTIGKEAFQNCGKLASLTIPNSVTTIGEGAFKYCSGLTEINIPGSVTSIGKGAFDGCTRLTNLTVDDSSSTYSLNNGALLSKNGEIMYFCLVRPDGEYTIPGTVTTIGEGAFEGCYDLTSVIIPDSVVTIGKNAFIRCSSLYSVTFGSNVETIGEGAFTDCGLSSVVIPNSVKTIGVDAFNSCYGLESVTIGSNVETIGDRVFYKCMSLNSVTIPLSVKSIGDSAFTDVKKMLFTPEMATLDVHHIGGTGAYQSADPNYRVELYKNADKTDLVDSLNTYIGTIYFKWIRSSGESFTVTFDTNGGSPVEPLTVFEGSLVSEPTVPTREGYTFTGWYTDEGLTEKYNFNNPVTSNLTLYAGWMAISYSADFNANGGMFTDGNTIVYLSFNYGETIVQPEEPTRDGYRFTGWVPTVPDTMPSHDMSFQAVWEEVVPEQFTVTFETNGGSPVEPLTVNEGNTIIAPTTTREGYGLIGWYTDEGLTSKYEFGTPVTGDMTLYAKWELKTYRISFIADGGKFPDGENRVDMSLEFGEAIVPPENPTKDGFIFTGWNLTVPDTMPAEDLTFTAQWEEITSGEFGVTFVSTGGTPVNGQLVASGEMIDEPTAPTREGYSFTGWYTDEGLTEKYEFGTPVTKNMTLYAGWRANTYVLKFDANGGTGTMSDQSFTYDASQNLTNNSFINPGYTFLVWNTAADGSGAAYNDGESVKNLTTEADGTVTLYAIWDAATISVFFHANGGQFGETNVINIDVTSGTTPVYEEPSREGYTFTGLFLDSTGQTPYDNMAIEGMELYAGWKANEYVVKFDANGGTGTMSDQSFTYDASQNLTNNSFTRSGYTFSGWNTAADGSGTSYTNGASVKNLTTEADGTVTLYAQWTRNYVPQSGGEGGTVDPPGPETDVEEHPDGSTTETTTETTTNEDGSKTESTTVVDKDSNGNVTGSTVTETTTSEKEENGVKETTSSTTVTTSDSQGNKTGSTTSSKTTKVTDTTTTVVEKEEARDADDNITSSTEKVTETTKIDGGTVTSETTEVKDGAGNVTSSTKAVKAESDDGSVKSEAVTGSGSTTVSTTVSAPSSGRVDDDVIKKAVALSDAVSEKVSTETTNKVIQIGTGSDKATGVTLSSGSMSAIAGAGAEFKVVNGTGTVHMDRNVLGTLTESGKDVTVSLSESVDSDLTEAQQTAKGGRYGVSITATAGEDRYHMLGGTVTVTIPYSDVMGADPEVLGVFYIDEDGVKTFMESRYDQELKSFVFATDHFSLFVVDDAPAPAEKSNTLLIVGAIVSVIAVVAIVAVMMRGRA